MEVMFKGGSEIVRMIIDRNSKSLQVASSKTNYSLQKMPWKMLFDKGKEDQQEKITDGMDDVQFRQAIVSSMAQIGYFEKNGL